MNSPAETDVKEVIHQELGLTSPKPESSVDTCMDLTTVAKITSYNLVDLNAQAPLLLPHLAPTPVNLDTTFLIPTISDSEKPLTLFQEMNNP